MAANFRAAVARDWPRAFSVDRKLRIANRSRAAGASSEGLIRAADETCWKNCERSLSYARTVCRETLRFSARNLQKALRTSVMQLPAPSMRRDHRARDWQEQSCDRAC